jgi:hypothetical protein
VMVDSTATSDTVPDERALAASGSRKTQEQEGTR